MSRFRPPSPPSLFPFHEGQDVALPQTNKNQHDDLDLDAGFEMSPFGGAVINLQFRSGFPLTIHRTFLLRSSKLALLCDATTRSLDLRHISGGAGHILVQYFYTNRYQALEWTGTPRPDAGVVRFRIAVEVYAAARAYELDGLEELAKEQIEGTRLHAFAIIDAVREAYPTPAQDDFWFPGYMKSRIKTAFEDPASLMSAPFQIDFVEPMSIAKFVFRSMLEVYCEMLELLTPGAAETTDRAADPLTPLTDVSFNDETASTPVVEPPEPVEDCFEERAVLNTSEHEDRSLTWTEPNIIQPEDIPHEEPPAEESTMPFSFEDHQADPEVALGFRYPFSGKSTDHQPEVSEGGPSFGDYDEPPQKERVAHSPLRDADSFPAEISNKQEFDSRHRVAPEHSPPVESSPQSLQDPPRELTPDRVRSESTPERATPSPPKEGDEFWASLSKRRKERIGKGRRATVTFDVPESGPPEGESSRKGKEPTSTIPQSVQKSLNGLEPSSIAPELTSLPYQHQDPPTPLNKLIDGGGNSLQSLLAPKDLHVSESEANTQDGSSSFKKTEPDAPEIPILVPPDPKIWGVDVIKTAQNDVLVEEPGLGAELEREQDTPEPTGGNDIWDTWGIHLSTNKKRRARTMSLSQDALAQVNLEMGETQTIAKEVIPHRASQESGKTAQDNFGSHVVSGGIETLLPEPEPTSGASILAQDDSDLWGQTTSPSISSDVPQGQHVPKKKRSKRSRKLKALAEEHGAMLTELTTEQTESPGPNVVSSPEYRHEQSVEVKSGDNTFISHSQSQPEAEPEREQDPWDFWGAKRSPSLRKSF